MKREPIYFRVSLAVFLTVCAILLVYDTLFGSRSAVLFGGKLMEALNPIFYGAMIAYLLAPVIDFIEEKMFPGPVQQARRGPRFCATGPRSISLIITWLLICVLGYLLLSVLLPELYRSVYQLIGNLENYYNTIMAWITKLLEENPTAEIWVTDQIEVYYQDLTSLLTDKVMPQAQQLMSAVSGGIVSAVIFLKNLIVGIIVSAYLLATKENCAAHAKKIVCGLVSEKKTYWVFRGIRKVDDIFSGFVRGKLLDSLIIGIICFVCSQFLQFPYAPLVSVIVGVTNIIPFFGPFLGAVPSLFLILLVSPLKALYFLIFIIVLQQVDGNIIGPKILGGKTGLSSLWVIIAILVGGSFFGITGMFFGVPVCACVYSLITFIVETRLKKRGLPVAVEAYRTGQPTGEAPGQSPAKKDGISGK